MKKGTGLDLSHFVNVEMSLILRSITKPRRGVARAWAPPELSALGAAGLRAGAKGPPGSLDALAEFRV